MCTSMLPSRDSTPWTQSSSVDSYISPKLSVSGDELEVLLRLVGDNEGVLDVPRDEFVEEAWLYVRECD